MVEEQSHSRPFGAGWQFGVPDDEVSHKRKRSGFTAPVFLFKCCQAFPSIPGLYRFPAAFVVALRWVFTRFPDFVVRHCGLLKMSTLY